MAAAAGARTARQAPAAAAAGQQESPAGCSSAQLHRTRLHGQVGCCQGGRQQAGCRDPAAAAGGAAAQAHAGCHRCCPLLHSVHGSRMHEQAAGPSCPCKRYGRSSARRTPQVLSQQCARPLHTRAGCRICEKLPQQAAQPLKRTQDATGAVPTARFDSCTCLDMHAHAAKVGWAPRCVHDCGSLWAARRLSDKVHCCRLKRRQLSSNRAGPSPSRSASALSRLYRSSAYPVPAAAGSASSEHTKLCCIA